ncbi:hypothetical protein S7711_11283 [Stachybotrys chartarum IBT 7711]|uniref:Uncharacterized protein n=1 Tax=Stachybotrys chartarum (strain CBS 109288 / IBT 7711) TaxID=1280523 RepID=A0A084AJH6_STACB|nr:hypothetical protein S7711_11283 [Stachybotrys chartarum IBT 7711]KFA53630.1 hypothetical protein S40293_11190 [Stachybotrys chartarum IBT 40293]
MCKPRADRSELRHMPRRAMSDDGDDSVNLEFDLNTLPGPSTCIIGPLPSSSFPLTPIEMVEAALAASENTIRSCLGDLSCTIKTEFTTEKDHIVSTWALTRGRLDTALRP